MRVDRGGGVGGGGGGHQRIDRSVGPLDYPVKLFVGWLINSAENIEMENDAISRCFHFR